MNTTKRLNILAASDIHGMIDVYRRISDLASGSGIDLVILAGDLTAYGDRSAGDEIKNILLSAGKPVLFIMGNMDSRELHGGPEFENISGRRLLFSGIPFAGYQYTNPFVGSVFEKSEADQGRDMERLSTLVDKDTVLVTHGPCHGILDEPRRGEHVGSRSLRVLCDKSRPRYHLFGHIHESCGVDGNHFNISYPRSRSVLMLEYYSGEYDFIKI